MSNELRATRDHCRHMAVAEPEEPLWVQLANEIDSYLAGELIQLTHADLPLEGL